MKTTNQPIPKIALPFNAEREAQAVREQRKQFNLAITAHDARTVGACWLPEVHVSTSDSRPLVGRDAYQKAFEVFFADPAFITFERTPTQVSIGSDGSTAAEHGEWEGRWLDRLGPRTRRGVYLASWHKTGGRWLLQAELFVPLGASE